MAEQVPAVVDNAAVIEALDGQAPQEDQPVQAQQNDTVANQVQGVGPVLVFAVLASLYLMVCYL